MSWFRRPKSETPPAAPPDSAPPPDAADAAPRRVEEPKSAGLVGLFRQGLKRTSDVLRTDIRDLVVRKKGQLVDEWLDDLYAILRVLAHLFPFIRVQAARL